MTITEFLKNNIVILDGGMGTLIQAKGIKPGENTSVWNITHPDDITEIHRMYYDAGSNVVSTNTFGANILNFDEAALDEIIRCAVINAKRARQESKSTQEKFIALDIGPTGKMLKPYGDLDFEDAVNIFKKTIEIGVRYDVDLIFIETMNDIYEAKAAMLAAKESSSLPFFISCAFDESGKMLTGATPEVLTAVAEGMGAAALGLNCSVGPDKLMEVAQRFADCSSTPVIFKPNAGLPNSDNTYNITPDEFSDYLAIAAKNGLRCLGGCCGTTPEHIQKVCNKTVNIKPEIITEKNITICSSYTRTADFAFSPVVIGERVNPTGKKLMKQALLDHNIGYVLEEAIKQTEAGADVLDVNVGTPGIIENELLPEVVYRIQEIIDLPLQLDSSDSNALENAIRIYNGKAIINSVNGSVDSMNKIFPLVKKYGGVLVALTLDENGIPDTADGRFKIAEKILRVAQSYGISKKDIVFDALTTTVAAAPDAGLVTLETIRRINEELKCNTVLGVSNISYGLPERPVLNSSFLLIALANGLSSAIINPCQSDMIKSVVTFKALTGKDRDFSVYTNYAQNNSIALQNNDQQTTQLTLFEAVKKGLSDEVEKLTEAELQSTSAMDIINNSIIPALNEVGEKYEKQEIFLPGLLISASAAKASFDAIKRHRSENEKPTKGGFVIATVKGDVHDIGKNIVKLLLENYGFNVFDLGKDVSSDTIVKKVLETKSSFLGLSALMTTTLPAMEETIRAVRESAPECKIVVGGAVLTEEYSAQIGADYYGKDAMATVRYALENC